jgi:hypothetical protein
MASIIVTQMYLDGTLDHDEPRTHVSASVSANDAAGHAWRVRLAELTAEVADAHRRYDMWLGARLAEEAAAVRERLDEEVRPPARR